MKKCIDCKQEIASRRLAILPDATRCLDCQYKAGDVPRIKRFDDSTRDGEIQVSTYYTKNTMLDDARIYQSNLLPGFTEEISGE